MAYRQLTENCFVDAIGEAGLAAGDYDAALANTKGALDWDRDEPAMRQAVAALQAWGYPIRLIGRDEMVELEPRLADPPPLVLL